MAKLHSISSLISTLLLLVASQLSISTIAFADLDPASPLLRSSGKSPTLETLDTGRFIIKPAIRTPRSQPTPMAPKVKVEKTITPAPESIAKPELDKGPEDTVQQAETSVSSTVVIGPPQPATSEETVTTTTVTVPIANPPAPVPAPAAAVPDPKEYENLTYMEKFRALILGTTDKELIALREKEKPKREGQNVLEIELAPTYFYFNSSSAYSVRQQSSSSPGFTGGLSLWVSPYFAIQAQTQASLGASISDLGTGSLSGQTLTKNRFGFSFRNIDLDSNESVQTAWGVYYSEFESAIATSVTGRVKTKSSGLCISFDAKIPSSATYQHSLGVSIEPKVNHKESSGSQNIKSGTGNLSSALSARFGGDIRFRRQNQIYWLAEHRYEKNLFKGVASYSDPKTGLAPDGVSIDHGLTLFSIGYRWGK